MAQNKIEWRVGVFVLIGLILLALLTLNFSKGMSLFRGTYELWMRAENVGGIKEKAGVLMSGVKVGDVMDTRLLTNGRVLIRLKIYKEFKIDRDARFLIDALGFLGDQYVAIVSTNSSGQYLTNGQEVVCEPPFNLQEAMRSTAGILEQAQSTLRTLDTAVSNVNHSVLSEATLGNFSQSISNLQMISASANQTLGQVDKFIETNGPVLSTSLNNLKDFSAELKSVLATNQNEIAIAVKNLRNASATASQLLDDVKATNGPAGLLLRDEQMKTQLALLVTNMNSVAENFNVFSSNLNQRGVWSMLWKPKPPKKSSGKDR